MSLEIEKKSHPHGPYEKTLDRIDRYYGTKLWRVYLFFSRINGDQENLKEMIHITRHRLQLLGDAISTLKPENQVPLIGQINDFLNQPKTDMLRNAAEDCDKKR